VLALLLVVVSAGQFRRRRAATTARAVYAQLVDEDDASWAV
jgi:hypothetical protein